MQAQAQTAFIERGRERPTHPAQPGGERRIRRARLTMSDVSGVVASVRRTVTVPGLPLFELRRRTWDPTPTATAPKKERSRTAPTPAVAAIPDVFAPISPEVHPRGHGTLARLRNATLRMAELRPFGLTGTLGYRLRRRIGWPNPDNDLAPPPQAIVVLQLLIPALAFVAVLWSALALSRFSDVKRGWELETRAKVDRAFVAQPLTRAEISPRRAGF